MTFGALLFEPVVRTIAPLGRHIPDVLGMSPFHQAFGIAARGPVASVHHRPGRTSAASHARGSTAHSPAACNATAGCDPPGSVWPPDPAEALQRPRLSSARANGGAAERKAPADRCRGSTGRASRHRRGRRLRSGRRTGSHGCRCPGSSRTVQIQLGDGTPKNG